MTRQTEEATSHRKEAAERAKQARLDHAKLRIAMDVECESLRQQATDLRERLSLEQDRHAVLEKSAIEITCSLQEKVDGLGEDLTATADRATAAGLRATEVESRVTAAESTVAAVKSRAAAAESRAPFGGSRSTTDGGEAAFMERSLDHASPEHPSLASCARPTCDRVSEITAGEIAGFQAQLGEGLTEATEHVTEADSRAEKLAAMAAVLMGRVAGLEADNGHLHELLVASEITSGDVATAEAAVVSEEKVEGLVEREGEEKKDEGDEEVKHCLDGTGTHPRRCPYPVSLAVQLEVGLGMSSRRISVAERVCQQADTDLDDVATTQLERQSMSDHHQGRTVLEGGEEIEAKTEKLWLSRAVREEWLQWQRLWRRSRDNNDVAKEFAGVAGRAAGERRGVVGEQGSSETMESLRRRVESLERWKKTAQRQLRRIAGDARMVGGVFICQRRYVTRRGKKAPSRRPGRGLLSGPVLMSAVR